jgi:CMP-N,N'-diacetyllegionaminic acid synthase
MPSIVALIPARAGSKRVPGKNIRSFAGHPLIAYTISAAVSSGVFSRVILSTESPEVAEIGRHYGAEVPFLRGAEFAGDKSPDIEWIRFTLERLHGMRIQTDAFSILRPTSPFRKPETIRRAWTRFLENPEADSLRAVEPCLQHPGKMWVVEGERMKPLLDDMGANPPWHSTPYQALPLVYTQNASLEIAWTRVPEQHGTIAGKAIVPFFTEGDEGFDINKPDDWALAELRQQTGEFTLPHVEHLPWTSNRTT